MEMREVPHFHERILPTKEQSYVFAIPRIIMNHIKGLDYINMRVRTTQTAVGGLSFGMSLPAPRLNPNPLFHGDRVKGKHND